MNIQRSLLVTGGAGFIGSNFVLYWLENHPSDSIVVLDALTYAGNKLNLNSVESNQNFSFVHGDICDTQLVERLLFEYKIDTVIHFAAESHVDKSITGPDSFIETNIIGTYSLLKAAKNVWIDHPKSKGEPAKEHRFHHVSTDEVYGSLEPNEPAFTESTPYAPNSPYSASKAASDHLVRSFHHTYGLKVTTSNCSNNYGAFHFPEKLIPLTITNILLGKQIPIYGDGKQVRDWLFVVDHVRGIEQILKNGQTGAYYNIGGQNEWSNIDIVCLICKKMNGIFKERPELIKKFDQAVQVHSSQAESLIVFVEDRLGHDRRYAVNIKKAETELSYKPKQSFESGISKTIEWYIQNDDWWESE